MEKALLIGLQLPGTTRRDIQQSLAELERLAETAGARAEKVLVQKRDRPDPAYLIGAGKAHEIKTIIGGAGIRTVIFDEDLRPVQQKNLEELIEAKIIDRTRLILDIFARRARSREGALQVERAQLEYYLPRLFRKGLQLDSQVGGIGTRRGPGERKLEIDQRRIRERIAQLDRDIERIRRHRQVLRRSRIETRQPVVAIVGYTNAGKSTFLNAVSSSAPVYADDKLFATLDPTVRRVKLPGGRPALFIDTVGFINKLPHALVAAFRATLEEITQATCLLHLVDVSDENCEDHIRTVQEVIEELGGAALPVVYAYTKADLIPAEQRRRMEREGFLLLSARTGEGVRELLARIETTLHPSLEPHRLLIPYAKSGLIAKIFPLAVIRKQEYSTEGLAVELDCTAENWAKIQALVRAAGVRTASAR